MKRSHIFTSAIPLLAGVGLTLHVHAGIPVIDGGNLTQNVMTAFESVAQTLKQVEQYTQQVQQYQTQLQQYENMLKNTVAPAAYIWDQANETINKLMAAQDMLDYYTNQAGSLQNYLDKYQDTNFYKNSPCFRGGGCTEADLAQLEKHIEMTSQSQKNANDALFKSISIQQDNLKSDARQLENLQRAASTADGQMKAIQYANQIASQQANQLLQLRSLLLAEQSVNANREAAELDEKSRGQAQAKKLTNWDFKRSPKDDY